MKYDIKAHPNLSWSYKSEEDTKERIKIKSRRDIENIMAKPQYKKDHQQLMQHDINNKD